MEKLITKQADVLNPEILSLPIKLPPDFDAVFSAYSDWEASQGEATVTQYLILLRNVVDEHTEVYKKLADDFARGTELQPEHLEIYQGTKERIYTVLTGLLEVSGIRRSKQLKPGKATKITLP
ncbi:hypothetical protein H6G89_24215 [Oscillatoria sp. FACHB-1407]|uniref:hypothetical protein n=1 Tax=Oscillatoria sp. FACHB-1407 TaxID=2692847 RepID=UPI001684AF28|nr:hypothetical protein [Oscillatoria sp. FACHB-1407]MBD2464111.1 hypothetical protein [Oscillatoria sp. FACHB-1407]